MIDVPHIMLGSSQVPSQVVMDNMIFSAVENGCRGFDTSPSNGTENMLGKSLDVCKEKYGLSREDYFISDKIDGIQIYKSKGKIEEYVLQSIEKLKSEYLDLVLIHWPFTKYFDTTWNSLVELKDKGVIRNIGLCNVTGSKYEELQL